MTQGGLVQDGDREFKAEAEVIMGLFILVGGYLRLRQRAQGSVALHTVKVAGVLFKVGDAKAHSLRIRPLEKLNINRSTTRTSSVLRTRPMRGKICVMLP